MSDNVAGKTIVITGASSGMGAAAARYLSRSTNQMTLRSTRSSSGRRLRNCDPSRSACLVGPERVHRFYRLDIVLRRKINPEVKAVEEVCRGNLKLRTSP